MVFTAKSQPDLLHATPWCSGPLVTLLHLTPIHSFSLWKARWRARKGDIKITYKEFLHLPNPTFQNLVDDSAFIIEAEAGEDVDWQATSETEREVKMEDLEVGDVIKQEGEAKQQPASTAETAISLCRSLLHVGGGGGDSLYPLGHIPICKTWYPRGPMQYLEWKAYARPNLIILLPAVIQYCYLAYNNRL